MSSKNSCYYRSIASHSCTCLALSRTLSTSDSNGSGSCLSSSSVLTWYGCPKLIMEGRTEGNGGRERPRTQWIRNMHDWIGSGDKELRELAIDRPAFSRRVTNAYGTRRRRRQRQRQRQRRRSFSFHLSFHDEDCSPICA